MRMIWIEIKYKSKKFFNLIQKVGELMKKGGRKYIVSMLIAILLMPTAIDVAFKSRESLCFGGEWLLMPVALLICLVIDEFKRLV